MRAHALLPVLLAVAGGCYGWHAVPPAGNHVTPRDTSRVVRITLADGTRRTLVEPEIARDTLLGWSFRALMDTGRRVPVAVPVARIRLLENRRVHPGRTAALALGVGLPVAALIVLGIAIRASFQF